ncbi:MAG: phosphonate C-P lyase system protein PhnH [Leptolyngbyaceae bacterium]|nr:phosphonate C-P lyase system protein PhnH [Leptolyngbyaceae bacterium]
MSTAHFHSGHPAQTPSLPGFQDRVQDAQATFRVLLEALAHPGSDRPIPVHLASPAGLNLACAAACLTLLDLDTPVWIQPTLSSEVKTWLLFHTGCQFTEDPQAAAFALINDPQIMPALNTFQVGTAEAPEISTTLLIQVDNFHAGKSVSLTGPGIQHTQHLTVPGLPASFWTERLANIDLYPLGVDVFLFAEDRVVGLPRTTVSQQSTSVNPVNHGAYVEPIDLLISSGEIPDRLTLYGP